MVAAPPPCIAPVDRGAVPVWARTGFSERVPRLAHVRSRDGRIVALLFGDPLTAPARPRRANKILWVARRPYAGPATLRIGAQRMLGSRAVGAPVARSLDVGPSILDLPAAGCWRLTLHWSNRTDTLDLRYRQR
jgi:hypothetical protein